MNDEQLTRLMHSLDEPGEPDPDFADALFARLEREQVAGMRRVPVRWVLVAAALLAAAAIGSALAIGGGFKLPFVVVVSPTPQPSLASPMPSEASASPAEASDRPPELSGVTNGWIAFAASQPFPIDEVGEGDLDIWFVALDQDARRVIGTDEDDVDQGCPALSADGRRLAYGQTEGSNSALVIADVSDDGSVSDRFTIDVGDGVPGPCPVWSPDGSRVAFGVPLTEPRNAETSAAGSEVWIVTIADRAITVLPDLLATDLEWSPDGEYLAIASGEDEQVRGEILQDGRIQLYAPTSGAMRLLEGTLGVGLFTWSPDSRFIAYTGVDRASPELGDDSLGIRVIDVQTEEQRTVAAPFEAGNGIGPVWSPDGETIAYERACDTDPTRCGGELHELVLVRPGDPSDEAPPQEVVIPTFRTNSDLLARPLIPIQVSWSPDGEYLLCLTWVASGRDLSDLLVAIPTDPDMPAIALADDESLVGSGGHIPTSDVAFQAWGRGASE